MKNFYAHALFWSLLLLLAFLPALQGQSTPNFFGKQHLVELQAGLLRAPGADPVTQSPPVSGASVEAKAFAGGTAGLRYHYSFLPRWSLDAGLGAGYYPFAWRINATAEWLGEDMGFNDERLYNSDGVFHSGHLGAAFHLLADEEHLLAIGAGLQGVYFPESSSGSAIGRGEFSSRPLQFSTTSNYGKEAGADLFAATYLTVQYFQKVNEWLVFSAALEGSYSGKKPGEFFTALVGETEELLGVYQQKYLPVSLRVGLGYVFGN